MGGVLARIWPGPRHLNKHVCRIKEGYLGNGQLYTKCEYSSRIHKKLKICRWGGVLARKWPGPSHLNKHVCRIKKVYLGNGKLYTKCEYRGRIHRKLKMVRWGGPGQKVARTQPFV